MVLLRKTLNMLAFCLVCLTATSQTMVYLERAGNLSFDQERIADAQILKNNVVFRHEDALMYCDSAYFYETSNSLDAFGHVRFVQGDTLKGFCDKLFSLKRGSGALFLSNTSCIYAVFVINI